MNETQLLQCVLDACATLGARTLHIRPARTEKGWRTPVQGDGKGFPDVLAITRDGRVLVRELKVGRNKPTAEQTAWLDAFTRAGIDAALWHETDWPDRILREIRGAA